MRLLMNEIFGEENFRNEIVLRKGNEQAPLPSRFNSATDFLFFFSKNLAKMLFNPLTKRKERELKWVEIISSRENSQRNWCYVNGRKFISPKGHHWNQSQENIDKLYNEGKIIAVTAEGEIISKLSTDYISKLNLSLEPGMIYKLENEERAIDNNWLDIPSYSIPPKWDFKTENSEILLKRVIQSTSNEGDLVMDFFLGSGTTTAVAYKLKRKWIGVEMGEHFYTVVLPRMKKVLAYDKSGISKEEDVKEKYNEKNAGGFFKYYDLEQYEQTLRKCHYIPSEPLFNLDDKSIYEQYIFLKDPKLLDAMDLDYKNNKIIINFDDIYPNIDIAETLSNLKGKWIKKINKNSVIL
ncbi:MAG: site-specific DNA-methyltransferase, partial [Caldisphaera sp.]